MNTLHIRFPPILLAITPLLAIIKGFGADLSWWVVLAPLWVPAASILVVALLVALTPGSSD